MTNAPAPLSADVLIIGWGLAGLVAAAEATAAGRRVILVDQQPRADLGGQAWWSFGGLFLVDSPEQRRMGIRDSIVGRMAGLGGTAILKSSPGAGAEWELRFPVDVEGMEG